VRIACTDRLREALAASGYGALLTFRLEHLRYVSPYRPPFSSSINLRVAAIVTPRVTKIFVPQIDLMGVRELAAGRFEAAALPINQAAWADILQRELDALVPAGETVAVDLAPAHVMAGITRGVAYDSTPWEQARLIKTPGEVASMRAGLAMVAAGMDAALDAATAGATELEVAAAAEHAVRLAGAEGFAFFTICATNGDIVRRRVATDRVLVDGDFVFVDIGAVHDGYTAEFSRSLVIGDAVTPEQQAIHQTAYEANQAMMAAIRPGAMASDLDRAARDVILASPYAHLIHRHVTGSGIGVLLQERPIVSDPFDGGVDEQIAAGMVLNVEPGVYHPEIGGLRAEDIVLVTETGCELLTPYPYDPRLI
jgi:Xaa-Pro aminopeptidase